MASHVDDSSYEAIQPYESSTNAVSINQIQNEYKQNYGKYLSYARLLTPSKQQAEDLVQQAFSNIVSQINRGNKIYSDTLGAYIKSSIRNVSISLHRKESVQPTLRVVDSEQPSPDVLHLMSEENQIIIKSIANLTASQQAIVVMYYFDNMKVEEIARDLNLIRNTVSTHLQRARKHLEKAIRSNSYFGKDVS